MNADEIKAAVSKVQEGWRPPSELARSTPRPVSLTWMGILKCCAAVLLVCGGAFLGPWLYVQAGRDHALAQRMAVEGALTSATVTYVGPAFGEDNHHKIRYRYQVNDRTLDASTTVGSSAAKGLQEASAVQVRYLATDPARSWIVGHEPERTPLWVAPLAGLGMLVTPVVLFLQIKRERSLLSEGRPAVGVVTKVRWFGGNHGRGNHRASYEFQTPDGQTYKGSFRGSKKKCGAAGDRATVLYEKDNPQRNARYPMQFVKIAEW
jgi:hypothetical protein